MLYAATLAKKKGTSFIFIVLYIMPDLCIFIMNSFISNFSLTITLFPHSKYYCIAYTDHSFERNWTSLTLICKISSFN